MFESLKQRMLAYFQGREAFVTDSFAGADPDYRLSVRLVSDSAWHSLFARNMFLRPSPAEIRSFTPDFTIIHAPLFEATPGVDKLNSEVFILVNFTQRLVLIGGTRYAGEIKKSVFGLLNYLLPPRDVLPMHGSANVGPKGDSAVFFGLSGTGKTTLSADGSRTLIGDDEHGWSPKGLFNFEGGCYAKVIKLSAEAEPEIYATVRRFGTVLENVVLDPVTREPDLDDQSLTENTRACYPHRLHPEREPDRRHRTSRQRHHADGGCLRRAAADRAPHAGSGDVSLPLRLHRHASPAPRRAWATRRRRRSPPASARRSCRAIRRPTPRCWASGSASTRPTAGWSIPAGPAAPMASASA